MPYRFTGYYTDNDRKEGFEITEHGEGVTFKDRIGSGWIKVDAGAGSASFVSARDNRTYKAYTINDGVPHSVGNFQVKMVARKRGNQTPYSKLTHAVWAGADANNTVTTNHIMSNSGKDSVFHALLDNSTYKIQILVEEPFARAEENLDKLMYQYKTIGSVVYFRFEDYDDDYNDSFMVIEHSPSPLPGTIVSTYESDILIVGSATEITGFGAAGTNYVNVGGANTISMMGPGTTSAGMEVPGTNTTVAILKPVTANPDVADIVFAISYKVLTRSSGNLIIFSIDDHIRLLSTPDGQDDYILFGPNVGVNVSVPITKHALTDIITIGFSYNTSNEIVYHRTDINQEQGCTQSLTSVGAIGADFSTAATVSTIGAGTAGDVVQIGGLRYSTTPATYIPEHVERMMANCHLNYLDYFHL